MTGDQDNLQRAWLHQLLAEHQHICWLYGVDLQSPVFEISEAASRAGSWNPGYSSLKIASWLIRDHDWHVVQEVLKHEMAHQYVHEVWNGGTEKPHGPRFQEACRRLGVHSRFTTATGAIPFRLPPTDRPRTIVSKVEKLLSLAQSGNEHEAALAMEKANLLLRKYNISRLEQGGMDDGYDYVIINHRKKRISAQQRAIAALLKDFFYVKVVVGRQFDARSAETFRVIELIGAKENLAVAEYVYSFLTHRLETLWQEYRQKRQATGRDKKSYQLGVLNGLSKRLTGKGQPATNSPEAMTNALILCKDKGLICYYQQRHPRLRRVLHQGPKIHGSPFVAGQEEGRRLVIHRAVTGDEGSKGKLLPTPASMAS